MLEAFEQSFIVARVEHMSESKKNPDARNISTLRSKKMKAL